MKSAIVVMIQGKKTATAALTAQGKLTLSGRPDRFFSGKSDGTSLRLSDFESVSEAGRENSSNAPNADIETAQNEVPVADIIF